MSASAPVRLTIEDYFRMPPTEPESEYMDGELLQKPTGTQNHSELQALLTFLLYRFQLLGLCRVGTELSVQVRDGAVLIPDVCLIPKQVSGEKVVTEPALLCIEILSPSDRFSHTVLKCEEYLRWGVPACWIFDPEKQIAWVMNQDGLRSALSGGTLEAGSFSLPLSDVFPSA